MNTVLKTILLKPELKSGIIVAPCLSGKTHALCAKAIQLASEGQQVLLVANHIRNVSCAGGALGELEKQLKDSDFAFRISQDSLNIVVNGGKIKICGLNFTPDKVFDTSITLDGTDVNRLLIPHKKYYEAAIFTTTAMDIARNLNNYASACLVRTSRSIGGDISYIGLSGVYDGVFSSDKGFELNLGDDGSFSLIIKEPDSNLLLNNPAYMSYVNATDYESKLKLLETDILKCYNYLQSKTS